MNMNILHVINIYFSLSYFGDQFLHFHKKGYKEHLVCSPSEYLPAYAERQYIEYMEVCINRKISIVEDLKAIWATYKYIKAHNIDVVEGHTPKGALVGMIAAWMARVPKRLFFRHGIVYETSRGFQRFAIKNCDRLSSLLATQIICVSPSVREVSIKDKLAPADKQIVLGRGTCGGVDTSGIFNPQNLEVERLMKLKQELNIRDSDFVIGFSGRLVKDKGIVELVEAFKLIKGAGNVKLLLVGMFEERDALPEEVKQQILNDKDIIYTGFINGGMQYYYALMNVYVLASYREGFPTGVLEAQSMALPVLTTQATGCRDSIVDGRTGLFITHDPKDIAEKIEKIRFKKVIDGNDSRNWVIDNFDNHIIWKEIEELYK